MGSKKLCADLGRYSVLSTRVLRRLLGLVFVLALGSDRGVLSAHETKSLSQNRRGLAHFAESSEQNVPVPFSAASGFRHYRHTPKRRPRSVGRPPFSHVAAGRTACGYLDRPARGKKEEHVKENRPRRRTGRQPLVVSGRRGACHSPRRVSPALSGPQLPSANSPRPPRTPVQKQIRRSHISRLRAPCLLLPSSGQNIV